VLIKKNRIKMRLLFSAISLLFILISCDENRILDDYKSMPDAIWLKNDLVEFNFTLEDTLSKNNVFIKFFDSYFTENQTNIFLSCTKGKYTKTVTKTVVLKGATCMWQTVQIDHTNCTALKLKM